MITAKTPADLLDKIYNREGWTRTEGEIRVRRANEKYIITRNNTKQRYEAVER